MPDEPPNPADNLLRGLRDHERDRALADTTARPIPPDVSAAREDPERLLGSYVLLEELGRGGMGVVNRAFDTNLHREVAIKRLLAAEIGEETRRRFKVEANAIARLEHPGIVTIFETSESLEGAPYIVMELVSGESLEAKLQREPLAPAVAAAVVRDVAAALAHAHERGILHRDVKPQNVFVQRDGRVRLMDFGLAREVSRVLPLTATGEVLGSPGYLAPEQARGDQRLQGPATDVYGLGGLLYRCLAGRPPFVADNVEALLARVILEDPTAPSALRPGVPIDLETIALRCLAKEPDRRYVSADLVREDLQRFLDGRPILARPIGPTERARLWVRRNRRATAGLALIPLVALGTGLSVRELSLRAEAERREQESRLAVEQANAARVKTIDETLAATRARTDEGEVDARSIETLVALGDDATTARLCEELDALTKVLDDAQRSLYRETLTLLPDEVSAGMKPIEGLDAALDSAFAAGPGVAVPKASAKVLDVAGRRLEDRAARTPRTDRTFRAPGVRALVSSAQTVALGVGGRKLSALLAAAISPREGALAQETLVRHMFADLDEERSARTAATLAARRTARAYACVVRRLAFFGMNGRFAELVKPVLKEVRVKPTWPASTGDELMERALAKQLSGDLEGAIADHTQAIAMASSDSRTWFWRGFVRVDAGQVDEAIADYSKAIELEPKDATAYLDRGIARKKKHDVAGARADAARALELDPSMGRAWFLRGTIKIDENDLKGGQVDLARAAELDPRDVPTWINLGVANMNDAKHDAAIAAFSRAIDLAPNDPRPISMRGNVRVAKGELEAGIVDLTRALAIDSKDAKAWLMRGVANSKLGHVKEAITDLTHAIEVNPKYWQAYINRGNTRRFDRDHEGAIADLTKAIELNPPGHPMAWMNRGVAKLELRDKKGALADFSKAIALDKRYGDAWRNRGSVYALFAEWEKAIADFKRAIELNPKDADAWNGLGASRVHKGEVDEGLADIEKALELKPESATIRASRGVGRGKKGDFEGALEDFAWAIERDRHVFRFHCDRAEVLLKKGEREKALLDLDRAIELEPTRGATWSQRAELREALGDKEGAETDRAKVKELSEKP